MTFDQVKNGRLLDIYLYAYILLNMTYHSGHVRCDSLKQMREEKETGVGGGHILLGVFMFLAAKHHL